MQISNVALAWKNSEENWDLPLVFGYFNCDVFGKHLTKIHKYIYIQVHLNKLECRGKVHLFQ